MKFDYKAFSEALKSYLEMLPRENIRTIAERTGVSVYDVAALLRQEQRNPRINDVLAILEACWQGDQVIGDYLLDDDSEEQNS